MQLTIKNLHNEQFTVECNDEDSVKALKDTIAARDDLREKYDPELLKLLYKGKVMDDEDSVASYTINPEGFLVLVKQTPGKPKPPPKKKPNQGYDYAAGGFNSPFGMGHMSNSFMKNPFSHDPFMQLSLQPNSLIQQPYPSPLSSSSPSGRSPKQPEYPAFNPAPNVTNPVLPQSSSLPEGYEKDLKYLVDSGFDRLKAEKALRASSYDLNFALDFLISGNVPEIDDMPVAAQVPIQPRPADIPIDKSKLPNPTSNETQNVEGLGMSLKEMNQIIQQNPEQLQIIKAAVEATQPEIARLIETDPQAFLDLMKQAAEEANSQSSAGNAPGTDANQSRGTIQVTLSSQEQQIINQMQEMGLDRNRAIEAFVACDRNPELAIEYLLNAPE
ncbi:unnamed protein product [Rotaria magnacalcarata]|uniref:UV excision repair protein RAD23 n=1 Tax=Rotaria magnacalcarata TaxID=392030 RepID=A0A816WYD5_9BILA|nr:unnamed protein product [Rotaria magnacalcarata]CAF4116170.1 unnamed protein product [Rotaria magnacalcarata]